MAKSQGVELGRGYVSLAISTRGLGREVAAEFATLPKAADAAGKKAGGLLHKTLGAGANAAAKDATAAAQKAASAQQAASGKAKEALLAEESAARKVAIAKKAHADAVAKHGEGSLQALRAADRLAAAELKHAEASTRAQAAEAAHAKATKEATAAKATAERATQRYERSLGGLASRLRAGITSPFAKLAAAADRDGRLSGSRFGKAVSAAVKNAGRALDPFRGLVAKAATAGRQAGAKLASSAKAGALKLGSLLKGGLAGIGAGAALSVGGVMSAGWGRFTALEDARAKLGAIAATAPHVQSVMDSALASVKGTSHGMAEAASTAAALAASNIKPGKDMTQWLTTTANSASLAGMTMQEMGTIFGKVAANGKVDGEVLAQLADRGVPALQFLADELGVTAAQARKMASDGKISAEVFEKAMRKGAGSAADALGKTTTGSIKNFGASIGRLGEKVISAFAGEDGIAGFFQKMTRGVDELAKHVEPAVGRIKDALSPLTSVLGGLPGAFQRGREAAGGDWQEVTDPVGKVALSLQTLHDGFMGVDSGDQSPWLNWLADMGGRLSSGFDEIADAGKRLWATIQPIVAKVRDTIVKQWGELQPRIESIMTGISEAVSSGMEFVRALIDRITKTIQGLWSRFGDNILRQIRTAMDLVAGVIDGAFQIIRGIFDTLTGLLTGDWKKMGAGLESITRGISTTLGAIFRGLVATLGNIWDGIKKVFAGPINWVIDHAINPLIDGINKVAETFGAKWRAPRMARVAVGSSAPASTRGGAGRSVSALAEGGRVGGYSPHPKADNILVRLTADEEVIRVQAARRLRRKHPGLLEYLNRTGDVPDSYQPHGYSGGGRIIPNARQGFGGYNESFLARIKAWAAQTGRTWSMTGNGGARSRADQRRAWLLFKSGRGPLAASPYGNGPHINIPGRGAIAMDLSPRPGEIPAARASLGRFGLGLTVRGEPWHVGNLGPLGGGVTSGGGGFDPLGVIAGLVGKALAIPEPFKSIFGGLPGKLLDLGRQALGFDAGGILPPGIHQVVNASGRPEAILTARQWETVEKTINSGLSGARITYAPILRNEDPRRQYEQFMWDLTRDAGRQVKIG